MDYIALGQIGTRSEDAYSLSLTDARSPFLLASNSAKCIHSAYADIQAINSRPWTGVDMTPAYEPGQELRG